MPTNKLKKNQPEEPMVSTLGIQRVKLRLKMVEEKQYKIVDKYKINNNNNCFSCIIIKIIPLLRKSEKKLISKLHQLVQLHMCILDNTCI